MKVEIFRRTVKDRRRGASWDLLKHMAEGIKSCGDEPVIVNENMTGQWQKDEMEPHTKIGCMFGYALYMCSMFSFDSLSILSVSTSGLNTTLPSDCLTNTFELFLKLLIKL